MLSLPPLPPDLIPAGTTPEIVAAAIAALPDEKVLELLGLVKRYKTLLDREERQKYFLPFVRSMWPSFIEGRHLAIMANAFERIAEGSLKRLMIHMPPRHSKSEMGSVYLPAWYLGRYPERKIIQCGNTAELAVGFGRRVRNLVSNEDYQTVFPGVSLSKDSKAAGRWNTNGGGEYFAIGAGGTVSGKGADLLVIDDPHSEQEAALAAVNPDIYDKVYEWYTSGPRQRLQPNGAIVVIATRWGRRDLPGQILKACLSTDSKEEWEVIEFPAILPSGNALWPEFWSIESLIATRDSLPISKWLGQYQQSPTSDEGAIVKREWWKIWEGDPPKCEFIIQAWDTAYTKKTTSDPTACTTWGVFFVESEDGLRKPNIILLDAFHEKLEFPELKKRALREWKDRRPDAFLVEAKASGLPLIQELRKMGIPVMDYTPSRGQDKFVRINAVADLFSSGMIWCPARRWAEEVIEELAEFPHGEHDDYVDSTSLALMRFRQGGFIALPNDEAEPKFRKHPPSEYY